MQIINWLQVFCSHLCKWLLLPFITASFPTCLSISSSWWCQNNISGLCCLWSDGAQMKAQAEEPTEQLCSLSGVWCWHSGCMVFTGLLALLEDAMKITYTFCSCVGQMGTPSKKPETRTDLKHFAHLLSYLQVHKVARMVGSMEIQDY